jgi:hypothetical protein
MKKILLAFVFCALVSSLVNAQDSKNSLKEIGFTMSGTQFGVRYKTGTETTLLRLTLQSIYGSTSTHKEINGKYTNSGFGYGLNIGMEKRKPLADNIQFYCGPELLTSVQTSNGKDKSTGSRSSSTYLDAGLGLVLGLNFRISEKLNISAEAVPALNYTHSIFKNKVGESAPENKTTADGFDFGLSTGGINLTVAFVF